MTADVYAGDDVLSAGNDRPGSAERFAIRLVADADPDVLLRVAAQLNVLNDAPRRFAFERQPDDTVTITISVVCSARAVDLVVRKLAQLTSVLDVSASLSNI